MFTELYNFQKDIVNKVLENTESTLIQLPTGGGKTIISKEIVIGLINKKNKKILFIVPKNILMEQTLKTFEGLKPQKVHGSNKFDKNHDISVSTLQTAPNRDLNPDVIIIDEVHFGYEKKMLNDIMANNPKARIIGLSATPYDSNGYLLKGFDVILNQYDMEYMIKNKYLVPLRSFILVKPDLSNVSIIAGDYELSQLSEAVSKYPIIMEIVKESKSFIEKSIKTIVFAVDINHAELLKTAFQNEGFTTEALHSKSEEEDKTVIKRFEKGYIKILVSVLKLTTGFNVPETDLAIIARPTKSQNLYKQMVGRVLRTVDLKKTGINKKYATLLDCGNVIKNLGKPLASIVPKDELERKVQKLLCKKCNSENIKLKKSKEKEVLYWECLDCGEKRNLENRNLYQCENCNKKYSYDNGDFELINSSLYLNCECGYETEISIATGDEEFKEVDSGINYDIKERNIQDKIENISFKKEKSLEEEIKEIKDKKNLKEKLESAKKNGKVSKIAVAMCSKYSEYLADKYVKNDLELLKKYMQSNLIKEHYHKILPEIIEFNEEKFRNFCSNVEEQLDSLFLLVKDKFYNKYLNQIYINEIKSFIQNQVENMINGCSEKLILAYKIPENMFNLIKEKQQDFFKLLTNEELENLEKEIKFLQIYLYIDYNWYVLSIYFDNNSSKIEKS